jgi:type III pantothenate kinase
MILTVDIGNTNTVCGVFEEGHLRTHFRFRTDISLTADELALLLFDFLKLKGIEPDIIDTILIACVVPPLRETWQELSERYLGRGPFFAQAKDLGIPILLENPEEVGVDRVLNALAGWEKYRHSLIIIDYGTATTFDCVSDEGAYLGGAIAPGLMLAAESLFQKASMLPRVELFKPPPQAIGKNTLSALKSGLLFGFAALTDGLVARLALEFEEKPRVIATGGLARIMQKICYQIERVEPFLTLEGLKLWWDRKKK